ncbi:hypothetical protein OY671_011321, partial [Metschnikowia pulcherrima]
RQPVGGASAATVVSSVRAQERRTTTRHTSSPRTNTAPTPEQAHRQNAVASPICPFGQLFAVRGSANQRPPQHQDWSCTHHAQEEQETAAAHPRRRPGLWRHAQLRTEGRRQRAAEPCAQAPSSVHAGRKPGRRGIAGGASRL